MTTGCVLVILATSRVLSTSGECSKLWIDKSASLEKVQGLTQSI